MIRYRTSYSSYPQGLWKRLPILRKLTIEAQKDLTCSIIEQHFLSCQNRGSRKSILFVHLFSINCALMNKYFIKESYCERSNAESDGRV